MSKSETEIRQCVFMLLAGRYGGSHRAYHEDNMLGAGIVTLPWTIRDGVEKAAFLTALAPYCIDRVETSSRVGDMGLEGRPLTGLIIYDAHDNELACLYLWQEDCSADKVSLRGHLGEKKTKSLHMRLWPENE